MANEAALQALQDQVNQLQQQLSQFVQATAGKVDTIVQNAQDSTTARDQAVPAAAAATAARDQVVPLAATVSTQAADVAAKYPVMVSASNTAVAAANNAQRSSLTCATWTVLSTLTPTSLYAGAEVLDSDTGQHTDPSTSATVNNAGRYTAYATTAGAWTRIGDTGLSSKAAATDLLTIANASAPSPLTSITGTANAIIGVSGTIRQVLAGCRVTFVPTANNTGATTLTITYVGGGTSGTFNVIDDNGGAIGADTLRAGYTYELLFTGSVWKIIRYGDDHERTKRTPQKLSSVAGTANAITAITAYPLSLADGLEVILVPTADNTGATTLSVNGGGAFNVQYGNGGALSAGALKSGRYYKLAWQATGSVWKILVSGYDTERITLLQNTAAPSMLSTVGGTANAITATTPLITQVVVNSRVLLFPTADNTGNSTLTLTYPDGTVSGTFNIVDAYGGQIGAGTLRAGRPYELIFSGSNWRIISYGDDHWRARVSTQKLRSVSGANAIVATTDYPIDLLDGVRVILQPIADNTDVATLTLNGGGTFSITHGYGSTLNPGVLKAGYYYELIWQSAGSVWKIINYGTLRQQLLNVSVGKVTAVAGTANAITVTTDMGDAPQPGCLATFVSLYDNTGVVTLNVNGTGDFRIKQLGGSDLAAGDIKAGCVIQVRWDGSPGNTYRLVSNGQTAGATATAAIENRDALSALRASLVISPYGSVSYSGGSRVIVPRDIVVTSVGSSVGTGAGATTPADSAPSKLFITALQAEMAGFGNLNFIHDNQSIGGQVITQFAAQLSTSTYSAKTFVLIVAGMNDFAVGSYNSGQTFTGGRDALIALIATIKAAGAVPVVITSPHMHPTRRPAIGVSSQASLGYPAATYNVTVPFVFNATNQTIYSDTFAYAPYGGGALKAGSTILVAVGTTANSSPTVSNPGTFTVSAVSSDGMTITLTGGLTVSVTETVKIQHINLSAEDHLVPPASQSFVTRDWTGNGISLTGDVRFWHGNNMLRDIAKQCGAVLIDAEQSFFKAVEQTGWDSVYDTGNYNHPNTNGYDKGFGAPLRVFAKQVAELIRAS